VITINEARRAMGQKPLKHPGADIPFINTSSGPLSLDILAEGGVRPQNMPPDEGRGPGKILVDSLLTLRKALREELVRRKAG
jgi:hypothetical protein